MCNRFFKKMEETVIYHTNKVHHNKFHSEFRGSRYRGVSINGKCWQVLIMIDQRKIYLCSTHDVDRAARLYDLAIIQSKGLGSKINFDYNKAQLLAILFEPSIVEMRCELTVRTKSSM